MYDVVLIGAGNIAANYDNPTDEYLLTHAHAISNSTQFSLAGFYDVDTDKAREAAKKWNCSWFQDMNAAIAAANVVCIAVPDNHHYSVLKQCLEKKSVEAVITEKPYMASLSEALNIQRLLNKYNIPVILNYSRRFMSEFWEMKQWITKAAGTFIGGNCFYGKGTLHNGSHHIDIMSYLLGNLEVGDVIGGIVDFKKEDPSFEFYLHMHATEGRIFFHPVSCYKVTIFEFDLMFDKGRVRYNDETGDIEYYEVLKENPMFDELNYVKRRVVKINPSSAMDGLYKNLYDVLQKRERPLCTEKEGIMVSQIMEDIYQYASKGTDNA